MPHVTNPIPANNVPCLVCKNQHRRLGRAKPNPEDKTLRPVSAQLAVQKRCLVLGFARRGTGCRRLALQPGWPASSP
eukprot:3359239-Rhodomonas_salina.1